MFDFREKNRKIREFQAQLEAEKYAKDIHLRTAQSLYKQLEHEKRSRQAALTKITCLNQEIDSLNTDKENLRRSVETWKGNQALTSKELDNFINLSMKTQQLLQEEKEASEASWKIIQNLCTRLSEANSQISELHTLCAELKEALELQEVFVDAYAQYLQILRKKWWFDTCIKHIQWRKALLRR